MDDSKRTRLNYIGYIALLATGLCCPLLAKADHFSRAGSAATLVWLYVFLELLCRCRGKKKLLVIGADYVISYCLIFTGALGKAWTMVVFAAFGAVIFAATALSAWIMRRWNRFPATLTYPAIWLFEYLIAYALRFPSLVRLDMMFADLPVLMQAERLIGPVGVSFAILWLVSILRFAAANRKPCYAAVGAGLVCLLLLPGLISLYPNISTSESVRVAYTTGPYVGDFLDYTTVSCERNEDSLEQSVLAAAREHAELLVFTEEAFSMEDRDEEHFLARCSALAEENELAILVGMDVSDTDNSEGGLSVNKAVMLDSSGEILGTYQKSNLIPILESGYEAGDGSVPSCCLNLHGKRVTVSYLICYDSNFPAYVNQINPDTDILLLPSWDWHAVTVLHSKLCRTLAVQNQVTVLKPTYDGLSVAVTPDGQVFHTSSTDTTGYEQVQLVELPVSTSSEVIDVTHSHSPLIYAIIGTEIMSGIVCLMLLIVNRIRNRERTKRTGWFTALVTTTCMGCCADALSWILDGAARLGTVLYVSTIISDLMTFVMIGEFVAYLTAYIKERSPEAEISKHAETLSWIYVGLALLMTLEFTLTGNLFTFENGVYQTGPLYNVYVVINALSVLLGFFIILLYRKALTLQDHMIACFYVLFPVLMAGINLLIEDWSFAYPATTVSLVLVYAMMQSDQMDRLEQQREIITYHATHDELTGLHNRRAFNDKTELLRAMDGKSGIIFSDINGLKYANDNYGHEAGDQLLIRYARLLTGIFRSTDLFRISGDEFICLMQHVEEHEFMEHVNRLEKTLQQDEMPLACFGAAYGPDQEIEKLMNSAEDLMYEEKERIHKQFPKIRR